MLNNYEISSDTYAIIAVNDKLTKIIEKENELYIEKSSLEIIKENCIFYGSSFNGRYECSKSIFKSSYKLPIVVEETTPIVFFPISSPKYTNSSWFALQNINHLCKHDSDTSVVFNCGKNILFKTSYVILKNQLLRATQLKCIMYERQRNKK